MSLWCVMFGWHKWRRCELGRIENMVGYVIEPGMYYVTDGNVHVMQCERCGIQKHEGDQ